MFPACVPDILIQSDNVSKRVKICQFRQAIIMAVPSKFLMGITRKLLQLVKHLLPCFKKKSTRFPQESGAMNSGKNLIDNLVWNIFNDSP